MPKLVLALIIAALGFAAGYSLPHPEPVIGRCLQAAQEGTERGLQGATYNVFVGSHGCVLRVETGEWLPE